jgi:tRNA (cytidine/uridine-2'-O-)-methyltransferase
MFHIVLHTPEIPPNTGSAMRLSAVTGCRLHLIEPLGFQMDDARLRRAGMDYRDRAVVTVHPDIETWHSEVQPERVFAYAVDADIIHTDVAYRRGDALLFGPESVGLPDYVKSKPWVTQRVRLPMVPGVRSLNLANSVAIGVYEAWRQLGFEGSDH